MSERLTDEQLRDQQFKDYVERTADDILALRDRNAALEGTCRSAGLCMSCLYGAADPIGCTDCLGTGWDGGDPRSQIEVLEARVAKLEAALKEIEFHGGPAADYARAALKDAPQ